MSMTLDSLRKMAADSGLINLRAANDGIFDIQWLEDKFNNQNLWFFDSLCNQQEAFIKTVWPFDSLWQAGLLRFERKVVNGHFNCTATPGLESALICNWNKVYKAAFSNGSQPDYVHIFSYNNGVGTGNGGLSVTGVGNESLITAPWQCLYWIREPKISSHEMGHGLGCDHALMPTYIANLMSQATSGGCALGSMYLPHHQQIILNYINLRLTN